MLQQIQDRLGQRAQESVNEWNNGNRLSAVSIAIGSRVVSAVAVCFHLISLPFGAVYVLYQSVKKARELDTLFKGFQAILKTIIVYAYAFVLAVGASLAGIVFFEKMYLQIRVHHYIRGLIKPLSGQPNRLTNVSQQYCAEPRFKTPEESNLKKDQLKEVEKQMEMQISEVLTDLMDHAVEELTNQTAAWNNKGQPLFSKEMIKDQDPEVFDPVNGFTILHLLRGAFFTGASNTLWVSSNGKTKRFVEGNYIADFKASFEFALKQYRDLEMDPDALDWIKLHIAYSALDESQRLNSELVRLEKSLKDRNLFTQANNLYKTIGVLQNCELTRNPLLNAFNATRKQIAA